LAELGEHLAELVVINFVIQVLDVQVDALVFVSFLKASSLIRLPELLLALVLLLGATDVELLAVELVAVQLLDGLGGGLVSGEVDETETTALAGLSLAGKGGGSDITVLGEELAELVVGDVGTDVLDVDVGEVGLHLLELALAVLLGDVVTNVDLLLVQEHTVDVLDGRRSSLIGLVVNETIALGVSVLILSNLAAEDVAEGSKGVVESLVVDGNVEVLDEDIALAVLAESGITLGPHDAAGAALDESVVELLESLLAIAGGVVVDVGIAEGAAGDGVTADTDRGNGANLGEELEKHGLGDRGVELANVEGGGSLGVRSGRVRGGASSVGLALELAGSHVGVDGGGGLLASVEGGVTQVSGKLIDSAGGNRSSHCA